MFSPLCLRNQHTIEGIVMYVWYARPGKAMIVSNGRDRSAKLVNARLTVSAVVLASVRLPLATLITISQETIGERKSSCCLSSRISLAREFQFC